MLEMTHPLWRRADEFDDDEYVTVLVDRSGAAVLHVSRRDNPAADIRFTVGDDGYRISADAKSLDAAVLAETILGRT